ncbi:MAG: hypothetical protein AAGH89_01550 [Verrucomicrobiota bacterium]
MALESRTALPATITNRGYVPGAINHNVVAESHYERTIPQSLHDWHLLANRNPG